MRYRPSGVVPVARSSNGDFVRPDEAEKTGKYTCPGCGEVVVLRGGDRRRTHFAHRRASCSPDSVVHRAAKARIIQVIEEWKTGRGPRPSVSRPCIRYDCDGGVVQDLPDDVTGARSEVRLPSGLVGDVVLYRGSEPAVVVELLVTSRVSREKAARFLLPWVELEAQAVLDRPYWWVAVQDGLHSFRCPTCVRRESDRGSDLSVIRDGARQLAERADLEISGNAHYHAIPHTCWSCSSEILVYAWKGAGTHSPRRPPEPIPGTVQHRVTEGAGNYWANCCPRCSAVQGDYYLVEENAEYGLVREALDDPYRAEPAS